MAMYHLNPETGEPGVCRAKKACPFGGGENHYVSKELARESYEHQQEMNYALTQAKALPSITTDAALASNLNYSGPKPRWFKKLPSALQEKFFQATPELLDVIDTPAGKVAVVWEKNSVESNDVWAGVERGYTVSRLTFRKLKNAEIIGYVKTTYVDEESNRRSFGTDEWRGFRFLADHDSFYGMDKIYPDDKRSAYKVGDSSYPAVVINPPKLDSREAYESLISKARESMKVYGERTSAMDEDELRKEVEKLQQLAIERMDNNVNNFKSAFIDQSRILEPHRGKGMGAGLYIYAAKRLAQEGKALRGSGLQSPEAKKAWLRMGADKRLPISVKPALYEYGEYRNVSSHYVMDFQGKVPPRPTKLRLTEDDLFTP